MRSNHRPYSLRMVASSLAVTALVAGTTLTSSCGKFDLDRDRKVDVVETRLVPTSERSKLVEEARQRLAIADRRLSELERELETATAEGRPMMEVRVKTLRAERETVGQRLDRLNEAAEETWAAVWQSIKDGIDALDAKLN